MNIFSFCVLSSILIQSQVHLCQAEEIQYSYKIESKHIGDGFGMALATDPGKLAILAPFGPSPKLYVALHEKLMPISLLQNINPFLIDMNKEFIVVGGQHPEECVYVYESSQPFALKARIPLGDGNKLMNVKITEQSTIAFVDDHGEYWGGFCTVSLYQYDGYGSWHLSQRLKAGRCSGGVKITGLTVNEKYLVVQNSVHRHSEFLDVYKNVKGMWEKQQIIKSFGDVEDFGMFMIMDDEKLVVFNGPLGDIKILTYELDPTSGKWINSTTLHLPGFFSVPAIENNILVVTINDEKQPEVSGVVYKFSKATDSADKGWRQVATLKTNGDPVKDVYRGGHMSIAIEGGVVYTGRGRAYLEDVGKVFVHKIAGITEN